MLGLAEAHEELAVEAPAALVQRNAVLSVVGDDLRPRAAFLLAWLLRLHLAAFAAVSTLHNTQQTTLFSTLFCANFHCKYSTLS